MCRFYYVCLCLVFLLPLPLYAQATLPELQDGDLIFQTTTGSQSNAIFYATKSPFLHVGLIRRTPEAYHVLEAVATVSEIPLAQWIGNGAGNQFAVYRYKDLKSEQAQKILAFASKYLGVGYDPFFSFENSEIYCSELVYYAYAAAGIQLGTIQRIDTLQVENPHVQALIQERWHAHPQCKDKGLGFEACREKIYAQGIITPASLAADKNLTLVYSNYQAQ